MRITRGFRYFFVLAAAFAVAASAHAAAIRSSARNQRSAVTEYSGFSLVHIGTEPEGPGDLAPPQLFEIIRPGQQAFSLGRLYTSCVCVTLEADKAQFAAGERAVLRLRNVRPSPPEGTMYALYAQLRSPVRTILRADTFLQSSQFIPAAPGEAPTRGNIVADGVLEAPLAAEAAGIAAAGESETLVGEDGVEIIVPAAEDHIPDTSEYTLRQRAEEAARAAKEAAEAAMEKTREVVGEAAAKAGAAVEHATEVVSEKMEAAKEVVAEKVEAVKEAVSEKIEAARESSHAAEPAEDAASDAAAGTASSEALNAAKEAAIAARAAKLQE